MAIRRCVVEGPVVHGQSCRACAVEKKESIFQMRSLRVRVLHPSLVSHSVTSREAFIYTSDCYTLVACRSQWSVTSVQVY